MAQPSNMSSTTEVVRPRRSAPRPSTWFLSTALPSPALAAVKTPTEQANPFHAPPTSFRSPHSAIKGKHKLSPSPSPRHHDFDFAMASPRPPLLERTPNREPSSSDNSSSPMGDSPTPGFGSISGKARMPDVDDSPIRHVPGHSRSLAAAARRRDSGDDLFSPKVHRSPPPKALFTERGSSPTFSVPPPPIFQPIRSSQSQDCNPRAHRQSRIPRPSSSHPNRTRDKLNGLAAQKKTVSLGDIQVDKIDEPFGNAFLHARKARASMPVPHGGRSDRPHRRTPGEASIARSMGQKSGLSLTLLSPNAKKPELGSNSSISSISSASLTPPMADEPVFESNKHLFDNVKPNPEIFEVAVGIKQKFKGRDSTSSTEGDRPLVPPSVLRVGTLPKGPSSVKRARSLGHRPTELPAELPSDSLASKFDFVVNGVSSFGFHNDEKPMMPNTPVKRHAFAHTHPRSSGRMAMSHSQPALGTDSSSIFASSTNMPPPSTRKALPSMRKLGSEVPQLTVTTTSSPDSLMDAEESSPTIGHGSASKRPLGVGGRISLLRRISSSSAMEGSEDEITPTKGGGDASVLSASSLKTPTPSPSRPLPLSRSLNGSVVPRLSLPTLDEQSKAQRRLGHRQSHPVAPPSLPDDEDIFESRFTSLGPLGRGAFSTVLQVQERNGKGIFAVKKTRGVFDGVKDRLRHLEEVDILRHLSKNPNPHVLLFVDAWEQNRQLYIQTEACVGSLAAFLEVYGQTNERMDEGRVWKIARDISDGIRHMHDNGVIHFDLKPHNILIASDRSLKIADFGFATRWPRISPAEILAGSGLGGSIGDLKQEKLHREGDHAYMPPEMLRGVFVMAADIFSFGLVIFETAMNIYLPTGGPSWQALRENNFGFLDLSSLSPQLSDFITNCLNADPDLRPTIHQVLEHPVIQRTWLGGAALQVEDPSWLASILSGSPTSPSSHTASETPLAGLDGEGDVIMGDA